MTFWNEIDGGIERKKNDQEGIVHSTQNYNNTYSKEIALEVKKKIVQIVHKAISIALAHALFDTQLGIICSFCRIIQPEQKKL